MPQSVCLTKNWNASKTRSVPSQMYLFFRYVQGRHEHVGVLGADGRVEAVGGHHEIVGGAQLVRVRRLGPVVHRDAELLGPGLQDLQQLLAAQRREALPADRERGAVELDVDVGPAGESAFHLPVHDRVGALDPAEGLVGEHDAEAEGVLGGVALPHGHLVGRVELLHQGGEVQAPGAAARDRDLHRIPLQAPAAGRPRAGRPPAPRPRPAPAAGSAGACRWRCAAAPR